ncbi:hypothetical protein [uncultured Agathobaculum sp.]|uniref:hypothetical protein n=1 Tax=uncultured Agathobaculum sp. TaxID=2048140 RepID=UPI00296FF851
MVNAQANASTSARIFLRWQAEKPIQRKNTLKIEKHGNLATLYRIYTVRKMFQYKTEKVKNEDCCGCK